MTTNHVVDDEQLGALSRRQFEIHRRVRDGSLSFELVMSALQGVIEGNFDVAPRPSGRYIDCDTQPYIPDGWAIEHHQPGGQLEFNPDKVELWLSEEQWYGTIIGNKLRPLVERRPGLVLNACVLDHLLANTNLILESWKRDSDGNTRYIYFWGTIYRYLGGNLCVRYLYWDDGQWSWNYRWLGDRFDAEDPAAASAS